MCGDGNSLIQEKVVGCSEENKVLRKQEWAQGHNERKGWFLPHDGRRGKDVGTEDSTGGSDSDTVMETKTAVDM